MDQLKTITPGTPDFFVCLTPQHNSVESERRGQVRDPGIVTDESRAPVEACSQIGQRKLLGEVNATVRQRGAQSRETSSFRFASHQEKMNRRGLAQPSQQLDPFCFRPVFLFASAAGMHRQPSGARLGKTDGGAG